MGIFKRIITRTSNKLLSKLGASRTSHRLVVNSSGGTTVVPPSNRPLRSVGRSKKSKRLARGIGAAAIPELLAAKNCLPPVQFHHVHGPNVELSPNKLVARRTQGFCQALVFSNRVILPNERVYIKVLEIAKGWSGTIRFGFTSVDPATLRYQMPKHACPDMTNAGHTWARALADEVVRRNSVIHLSYSTSGHIYYGINNQDCGIFYANVNTSQHLWFIVDIYGLTAAVELIDPRIHNASRELDFSRIDEELRLCSERSPSLLHSKPDGLDALHQFQPGFESSIVRLAGKKKRTRKASRNHRLSATTPTAALIYEPWTFQNGLISNGTVAESSLSLNLTHPVASLRQAQFLPNLNSVVLPTAQQNIYSPMPNAQLNDSSTLTTARNINETHDYHQIMTNNLQTSSSSNPSHNTSVSARTKISSKSNQNGGLDQALSSRNRALFAQNPSSASANQQNTNLARGRNVVTFRPGTSLNHGNDESDICQQLDGLRFSDNTDAQKQQSATKSTKSTSTSAHVHTTPVAAMRTSRQQSGSSSKRTTESFANLRDRSKINPRTADKSLTTSVHQSTSSKVSSTWASPKPRVRHSTTKVHDDSPKIAARDSGSNPAGKDCPICFERPINCVLYQCGHMCTCYECGVKQWKTQSRTCPICRTIIKDVIKTYLS